MKRSSTFTLVGMGILTAIVVVLQAVARTISFGTFSITLVLAPIVIGAALFGWKAGGWLGFVFGLMVLLTGDAAAFLQYNAPAAVILCLLKGALAGMAAGAVYKLLADKTKLGAVICAGVVCPVVNTGVFLIGSYLFFLKILKDLAGSDSFIVIFLTLVTVNFLVELGINLVLSTVIVRIIDIVQNRHSGIRTGEQGA